MTQRLLLLLLSIPAFAADLPSAESLLDKFVQVTGGQQAYAARKSEVAHGIVEMSAMGIKGTMTRYAAEPDKYLLKMEIPGIGTFLTGAKDGIAWDQSDLMGPRVKPGLEKAEALREARFNATAGWRDLYPKVETVGEEPVDGEDCYKVSMTPTEGPAEAMFLSKKTGLARKILATASTQLGDVDAELLFTDYKDFGGLKFATRNETTMGPQKVLLTLNDVIINGAPETAFAVPDAVRPLIKK